jgi:hypothetical protein
VYITHSEFLYAEVIYKNIKKTIYLNLTIN